MKRILSVLAVVALVAMTAQAVDVKSENVAGVINIEIPAGGLKIVGLNLDAFATGEDTLLGILGGQLAEGGNFDPSTADKVLLWNGSSYDVYGVRADDHQFHDATDLGTWLGAAVNPTLGPGDAFWVEDAVGDGVSLSLTGQAVASDPVQIAISAGLQFVSYPLSAKIDIQSTNFANETGVGKGGAFDPSTADKIILWNGSSYDVIGLKDDNQWYDATDLGTWLGSAVTLDIDLGVGFWYEHQLSGFTWTETNPYLASL
ncbi:MAG: hypothetical protein HQ523_08680 [Lentisphaerae bacterium]|nr:hypothetical protein [Lentisphaerota bacterium]